jgi:hypothetical protein
MKSPKNSTSKQQIIQSINGQMSCKDTFQNVQQMCEKKSTSLILRKRQIKTTLKFHLIPVRMAIIKKSKIKKC